MNPITATKASDGSEIVASSSAEVVAMIGTLTEIAKVAQPQRSKDARRTGKESVQFQRIVATNKSDLKCLTKMAPRLLLCLARLEPPPDYLRQNCDVEKSSCGAKLDRGIVTSFAATQSR